MYTGKLIFSQITDFLPMHLFRQCVERYRGNYKVKSFSCLDQYLCMFFAQLTYRESLRDIEVCLKAQKNKLYHMGIRSKIARNTLANANKTRDWRIYSDFAQLLIAEAQQLYCNERFSVDLQESAFALDSTTIDLSLSLFPWASFRQNKGAVKLHTLLDLRGNIPTFIHISNGKLHDVNILDQLIPEPGSFYIMDRGYLDFARLNRINQWAAFFVIRAKSNFKYQRIYSHQVNKETGIRCDQSIKLTGFYTSQKYPIQLRRIKYFDTTTGKILVFLTNNFSLPATTIAELFRCRWQIEIFFKWIKQHLRIKSFFGTTENAVKSQIWIAVSVYVLIAIIKKHFKIEHSLYTILQVLSLTVFEKMPLLQIFKESEYKTLIRPNHKQLNLFD